MQDLLALWDAIFADGVGFELVDFVFVAMLLYIRDLRKSFLLSLVCMDIPLSILKIFINLHVHCFLESQISEICVTTHHICGYSTL